ncbi:hypothetical protein R3P38DRAFT_3445712 [Favolaschia claudopus]|uniref:Uncharacterized protein n=1 Tax=Favolaschia claudopus TaxID=2862362 RepID=A0AAV9ZNU8_9AGAR
MTSTRPLPAIVFYDDNTEIQCPYTFCGRPLEVKTSRLRRPRTKEADHPALAELNRALDAMLISTSNSDVLPASQNVAPNTNGWRLTQGAMGILPRAKTRARPAGDPHYGGGVTSGGKVKRARKTRAPAPAVHTQNAPETSTPSLPATPLPQTSTTTTAYVAPSAPVIQDHLPTPSHMYPGSGAPLFYPPIAPYYYPYAMYPGYPPPHPPQY